LRRVPGSYEKVTIFIFNTGTSKYPDYRQLRQGRDDPDGDSHRDADFDTNFDTDVNADTHRGAACIRRHAEDYL
jgi:hypothetical protein